MTKSHEAQPHIKLPPTLRSTLRPTPESKPPPVFERLSTPKAKDRRWIPGSFSLTNRPSVYWLDYLIDETPQKLKTPEALASYYNNFVPKFPRMRLLSAPKIPRFAHDDYSPAERIRAGVDVAPSGVRVNALNYVPSNRIIELSRPKTSSLPNQTLKLDSRQSASKSARREGTTEYRSSPMINRKVRAVKPSIDLAGGDFRSRSQHRMVRNDNVTELPQVAYSQPKSSRNIPNSGAHKDTLTEKTRFPVISSSSGLHPVKKSQYFPKGLRESNGDLLAKGDFVLKHNSPYKNVSSTKSNMADTYRQGPGQPLQQWNYGRLQNHTPTKSRPYIKPVDSNNNADRRARRK